MSPMSNKNGTNIEAEEPHGHFMFMQFDFMFLGAFAYHILIYGILT